MDGLHRDRVRLARRERVRKGRPSGMVDLPCVHRDTCRQVPSDCYTLTQHTRMDTLAHNPGRCKNEMRTHTTHIHDRLCSSITSCVTVPGSDAPIGSATIMWGDPIRPAIDSSSRITPIPEMHTQRKEPILRYCLTPMHNPCQHIVAVVSLCSFHPTQTYKLFNWVVPSTVIESTPRVLSFLAHLIFIP